MMKAVEARNRDLILLGRALAMSISFHASLGYNLKIFVRSLVVSRRSQYVSSLKTGLIELLVLTIPLVLFGSQVEWFLDFSECGFFRKAKARWVEDMSLHCIEGLTFLLKNCWRLVLLSFVWISIKTGEVTRQQPVVDVGTIVSLCISRPSFRVGPFVAITTFTRVRYLPIEITCSLVTGRFVVGRLFSWILFNAALISNGNWAPTHDHPGFNRSDEVALKSRLRYSGDCVERLDRLGRSQQSDRCSFVELFLGDLPTRMGRSLRQFPFGSALDRSPSLRCTSGVPTTADR